MKRRVRPNHEKYEEILSELGIKEAGIYGEQALDYYLKLLPETDTPYYIFYDLRLPYRDSHFQIDTLILFSNFYLLLEVKYLRGLIHFDPKIINSYKKWRVSHLKRYKIPYFKLATNVIN